MSRSEKSTAPEKVSPELITEINERIRKERTLRCAFSPWWQPCRCLCAANGQSKPRLSLSAASRKTLVASSKSKYKYGGG